jgi:transcriptional regulator with XRE-family HTH domain
MNKFKEFRQARGYTQEKVAEMLRTTQQTVARWESGRAEPSLAALRDLAVIFSTSVDDLLGRNPFSDAAVTNSYFSLDDGDEHFWGHFGVLLAGEKYTRWYPITLKQANQVDVAISRISPDEPWLAVSTLNNRMLLINVPKVHRIHMLDDNADEVANDWELGWDSYQGHSLEVYRALANWAMAISDDEDEGSSKTFKEGLDELIKEEGLTEDLVYERVIDTHLHFTNGQLRRSTPDREKLFGALIQVECSAGDFVFDLSEPEVGLTSYVPAKAICMLDMPLYQVMDAAKEDNSELEQMKAVEDAEAAPSKVSQTTMPKKRGRPGSDDLSVNETAFASTSHESFVAVVDQCLHPLDRRSADRICLRALCEERGLRQHPIDGDLGDFHRHTAFRSQAQQMAALHGMAFAADVHVVMAHGTFAEGQVEGWSQPPAPIRPRRQAKFFGWSSRLWNSTLKMARA